MSSDMLTAALSYAQRGWLVLPLHTPVDGGCSCKRGAGCTAVGKHPRTKNGLADATTDESQIRTWWSRWPDANVGILTGRESGLLVVDVDNKGGKRGSDNLAVLGADFGMPTTLTATTGEGIHLFFKHPGVAVKNGVSKVADGVDVRSEKGYVVAAPSLHANGKRYAFTNPEQPMAEVPTWLIDRMTTKKENTRRTEEEEHNPFVDAPVTHEGERNDTLYKLGCALRGKQAMQDGDILAVLLQYNAAKCVPPLDEDEIHRITESVCEHPTESDGKKSGKRLERNPLYWFKFNVRDFYADQKIQMMTDYQIGWCIRLRASAWLNGGFLPADQDRLWRLAGAKSKRAFDRDCELVLKEYAEVVVGGECKLKHEQLAAQYADTLELWLKVTAAGQATRARFSGLRAVSCDANRSVPPSLQ
jgi:hypothetical protein